MCVAVSTFEKERFSEYLNFELIITPRAYLEQDHLEYFNLCQEGGSKYIRKHFTEELHDEGKNTTPYRGILNEGTTCYMNSLLQTLFILKEFRAAIFKMPTQEVKEEDSIPLCLQRIFYCLQADTDHVRTWELINAFGWN
jgi:uncharacterized UBP type Zn finger protein